MVETGACGSCRVVVTRVGGVGGRHTHAAAAAEHWVQCQVIAATCGWQWQSTNKSHLSRLAHHG